MFFRHNLKKILLSFLLLCCCAAAKHYKNQRGTQYTFSSHKYTSFPSLLHLHHKKMCWCSVSKYHKKIRKKKRNYSVRLKWKTKKEHTVASLLFLYHFFLAFNLLFNQVLSLVIILFYYWLILFLIERQPGVPWAETE